MFVRKTSSILKISNRASSLKLTTSNRRFSSSESAAGGINYVLGPDQQGIFDLARQFAKDEIMPM
jgi:hypothetical protein